MMIKQKKLMRQLARGVICVVCLRFTRRRKRKRKGKKPTLAGYCLPCRSKLKKAGHFLHCPQAGHSTSVCRRPLAAQLRDCDGSLPGVCGARRKHTGTCSLLVPCVVKTEKMTFLGAREESK